MPAQITIQAYANAPAGRSIVRVDYFADSVNLGQTTSPPHRWIWSDAGLGTHTVSAVAVDNLGDMFASGPVEISVGFATFIAQFIPPGSVWRFLDDGSNQGSGWAQLAYNDTGWTFGPGRLGYGGDGEETTVGFGPSGSNKYITTYFRHSFNIPDETTVTNFTFRLQRDDGAVVWLNGAEVFRNNMPDGPITSSTLAAGTASDDDEINWFTVAMPVSGLPAGPNLVAVEVHQAAANSSDMGFDLELIGVGFRAQLPPPELRIALTPSQTVIVRWPASATLEGWKLYNTGSANPGISWFPVTVPITVMNNTNTVTVSPSGLLRIFRLQK
jgi:hypothetical protein